MHRHFVSTLLVDYKTWASCTHTRITEPTWHDITGHDSTPRPRFRWPRDSTRLTRPCICPTNNRPNTIPTILYRLLDKPQSVVAFNLHVLSWQTCTSSPVSCVCGILEVRRIGLQSGPGRTGNASIVPPSNSQVPTSRRSIMFYQSLTARAT